MRLDARNGDHNWTVWRVEDMKLVEAPVLWVDDVDATWCVYVEPAMWVDGAFVTQVHRAREIRILPGPRMVLIHPFIEAGAPAIHAQEVHAC